MRCAGGPRAECADHVASLFFLHTSHFLSADFRSSQSDSRSGAAMLRCSSCNSCMQCRSVGWATRTMTGQSFVSVSALPTKSKELFCSLRGRRRRLRMWMECKRLRSGNDRDHPCSITIRCLIKISQVWAISRVVMGSGKHGSHR
jgi:hypothetical protein